MLAIAMISFEMSTKFLSTMNRQSIVEYIGPMISIRFEMIKYRYFGRKAS